MAGNNVRRNFEGDTRMCNLCSVAYQITAAMCRNRKYSCPRCDAKRAVDWAKRNRDKKRAANNAYSSRHSSGRSTKTAAYRARHPEKAKAHQMIQTALRNGSITRLPCVVCGSAKTHAHHDDYAQPLSVSWLCHRHHMEQHAMLAAREVMP